MILPCKSKSTTMKMSPKQMLAMFSCQPLKLSDGFGVPSFGGAGWPLPAQITMTFQNGFHGIHNPFRFLQVATLPLLKVGLLNLVSLCQIGQRLDILSQLCRAILLVKVKSISVVDPVGAVSKRLHRRRQT